jgi:hypothetical protein
MGPGVTVMAVSRQTTFPRQLRIRLLSRFQATNFFTALSLLSDMGNS